MKSRKNSKICKNTFPFNQFFWIFRIGYLQITRSKVGNLLSISPSGIKLQRFGYFFLSIPLAHSSNLIFALRALFKSQSGLSIPLSALQRTSRIKILQRDGGTKQIPLCRVARPRREILWVQVSGNGRMK